MTDFFRFPSTPYLFAPAGVDIRADKVLTDAERAAFLDQPLHVEEKLDGENLGISFDGDVLRFQTRGSYVSAGGRRFRGIDTWIRPRRARLVDAIGTDLILFGEWCAVQHSVRYERLPDWFALFDVYQRSTGRFWEPALRDELARDLGLAIVPFLAVGRFDGAGLVELLGVSRYGHEPMEGIVARALADDSPVPRAKLVRAEFVQEIDEHWMTTARPLNRLAI